MTPQQFVNEQQYIDDSERLDSGFVYRQAAPVYRQEDILTQQAMAWALYPGQWLAANVRPPLPQIRPFPPRFGYPDYNARQPGLDAILDLPYAYQNRRAWNSGGPAGWAAAARNVGSGDMNY